MQVSHRVVPQMFFQMFFFLIAKLIGMNKNLETESHLLQTVLIEGFCLVV